MGNLMSTNVTTLEEVKDIVMAHPVMLYSKEHPWKTAGLLFLGYSMWGWLGEKLTSPKLPPGPLGLPFFGNMLSLSNHFDRDIRRIGANYGDVFQIKIASNKLIWLNSYEAIKEGFGGRGGEFANRRLNTPSQYILDLEDDLFFSPYSDEFVSEKKFMLQALRKYGFGTRVSEERMQTEINQICELINQKSGEAFQMRAITIKATANVIFSILMNYQFAYDDPAQDEVIKMVQECYDCFMQASMFDMTPRFLTPILGYSAKKKIKACFDRLRGFLRKIINEHTETYDADNHRDTIDELIERKGDKFNPNQISDRLFIFFEDAIHTTSLIIEWVLLYAVYHPEVQKRFHDDLERVVGRSRMPSLDDRADLAYIDATILEVMRVTNFIGMSGGYVSMKDTHLRGYLIPKNTTVMANLSSIHQNPDIYPEPDKFQPERFLDAEGKLLRTDQWMMFGLGPRKCLGESLAKQEIFLFTATLFQRYKFTFDSSASPPTLEWAPDKFMHEPIDFKVCVQPL